MSTIRFGIVGAGWRTAFFMRIAKAFPEQFQVVGVVVRNEAQRAQFAREWGVACFASLPAMADAIDMDFVTISARDNHEIMLEAVKLGLPCLSETPPASDLDDLTRLFEQVQEYQGRVQVAEQYHLRPHHQAQFSIIHSGLIGSISQAQCSIAHGYHGMSMIRRFLGIMFENAAITATQFSSPIVQGPTREGTPHQEKIVASKQLLAWLHFENGQLGTIDFTSSQYRAWIRGERTLIRGEKGEIEGRTVRYLKSFDDPMEFTLERIIDGQETDIKPARFVGYRGEGNWHYRCAFGHPILSDDEIAIAHCLVKMKHYLETGEDFYALSEACQDTYLALVADEAQNSGKVIETTRQIWAKSL